MNTKEKLRELCDRFVCVAVDDEDTVITEWLEQNPLVSTETKVVGLSDEQILRVAKIMGFSSDSITVDRINTYLKTQTFMQPEVKKVVVGLSDEQIESLTDYIGCSADTITKVRNKIVGWLKTQTFSQPAVGNSDTSSNWDDAWIQELSTELAGFAYSKENIKSLITAFLDKKPNLSNGSINWQQTLQERPKPTPQVVEANQVWIHTETGNEYIIDDILTLEGHTKLGDWSENLMLVVYNPSNVKGGCKSAVIYRRTLSDFLAKFEMVR